MLCGLERSKRSSDESTIGKALADNGEFDKAITLPFVIVNPEKRQALPLEYDDIVCMDVKLHISCASS